MKYLHLKLFNHPDIQFSFFLNHSVNIPILQDTDISDGSVQTYLLTYLLHYCGCFGGRVSNTGMAYVQHSFTKLLSTHYVLRSPTFCWGVLTGVSVNNSLKCARPKELADLSCAFHV